MPLNTIPYDSTIPATASVVAIWPTGATLPGDDALRAAVLPYGEPFKFSYLAIDHVGVKLAEDTRAVDLGSALAAVCSGQAPALFAVPAGTEDAVEIEITGQIVKEDVEAAINAFRDLTTGPIKPFGGGFPWLIGAAVLGVGLMAIGAVFYLSRESK
jgi:hypothetical protein